MGGKGSDGRSHAHGTLTRLRKQRRTYCNGDAATHMRLTKTMKTKVAMGLLRKSDLRKGLAGERTSVAIESLRMDYLRMDCMRVGGESCMGTCAS